MAGYDWVSDILGKVAAQKMNLNPVPDIFKNLRNASKNWHYIPTKTRQTEYSIGLYSAQTMMIKMMFSALKKISITPKNQ